MRRLRKKTPVRDLRTYGGSRAVRLPSCDYAADVDIHVTLCADSGVPFNDDVMARMVCDDVDFYCQKLRYTLYGYCLMPDHLHVLLSPGGSGTPLHRWLDLYKSHTTHEFIGRGGQAPLWQRSAYDHICRAAEPAEAVLAYIANNPLRAGLVECWEDWPWTRVFI